MSIPIENIYYLLCYAWNHWNEGQLIKRDIDDKTDLMDLFAQVLINGISYLRRRGMDRGYIKFEEDTSTIRGKIVFGESLKRNLFKKAKAHCEYDTLSYNVLHNQILKGTIQYLVKVDELNKDLKFKLRDILGWFSDVDAVPPTKAAFRRVQLNRNNAFYGFLLNVCRLIAEKLLVMDKIGETYFHDFLRDKNSMSGVFEAFVRNFYRMHAETFSEGTRRIGWDGKAYDDVSARALPGMLTDITLKSETRMIIIDTKYYPEIFTTHPHSGEERLRSGHLYQLFAYLKNIEREGDLGQQCEGILLYPTTYDEFEMRYELGGHHVRICTINLNQNWLKIHEDLLDLIGLGKTAIAEAG